MKFKKILSRYSFLIGLIIFILILRKINFQKVFEILPQVNPLYLILAWLLSFPLILIKAYRWRFLMKKIGIYYNLYDSFLLYNIGLYLGFITPARLGDFAKVFYLKKDGYSVSKSCISILIDRVMDIIFIFSLGLVGMLFFFHFFQKQIIYLILILFLIFLILYLAFRLKFYKKFFRKCFYFLVPKKFQESLKLNLQDFFNNFKNYQRKDYLLVFLLTTASWFFYFFQISLLSKSFEIDLSLGILSLIISITILVTLIPISLAGIGTREASLIFLLSLFNISSEKALTFSLSILILYIFTSFIGLICWLKKPLKF